MYNNPYENSCHIGEILKKNEEKNEIRKEAKYIGLAYLIMTVVGFSWSFVYIALAMRLGISYNTAVAVFEEPALMHLLQILLSITIFLFPFLIVVKNSARSSKEILAFGRPNGGLFLPMVLIGIGFCAFGNIATGAISNFFSFFGIELNSPKMENPDGVFGFLMVVISTAIVPALVEEFAVRGAVLGTLRRFGDGFAIIVSAIIFGLMHGNLVQMPFAFVVGLALGYAVVKTGSVWTGVVIHFINNFVSILLDEFISSTGSVYFENAVGTVYYMVCLLCFFVGLLLMKKKEGSVLNLESAEMSLTPRERAKEFFCSPMIIICLVLTAIECIVYTVG